MGLVQAQAPIRVVSSSISLQRLPTRILLNTHHTDHCPHKSLRGFRSAHGTTNCFFPDPRLSLHDNTTHTTGSGLKASLTFWDQTRHFQARQTCKVQVRFGYKTLPQYPVSPPTTMRQIKSVQGLNSGCGIILPPRLFQAFPPQWRTLRTDVFKEPHKTSHHLSPRPRTLSSISWVASQETGYTPPCVPFNTCSTF